MRRRFLIIGHRGAKAYETENSLASFRKAVDMTAEMIEFDVRGSKDGKVVVMHDASINRVAKLKGIVSKMNFRELLTAPLKNSEPIPSLEQVFRELRHKCLMNVEIKSKHIEKEVVRLISKYRMRRKVIVSSSDVEILRHVKKVDKRVRIALICMRFNEKNVELAQHLGCHSIHPHNRKLTPSIVAYAHIKGMRVYPWTVNGIHELQHLVKIAADGVITDKPDVMRKSLRKVMNGSYAPSRLRFLEALLRRV